MMLPNYQKLYEAKEPTNLTLSKFTFNELVKIPQVATLKPILTQDFQDLNQALGKWITPDTNLMYIFSSYLKFHYYRVKYTYDNNKSKIKSYTEAKAFNYGFDFIESGKGVDPSTNLKDLADTITNIRKTIGGLEAIIQFQDLDSYLKSNKDTQLYIETQLLTNTFPSTLMNQIYAVIVSSNLPNHPFIQMVKTISTSDVLTRGWGLVDKLSDVSNPQGGSVYKYVDILATDKEDFNNLINNVLTFNNKVFNINSSLPKGFYANSYETINRFTSALHTVVASYYLLNTILTDKFISNGGTDLAPIVVALPTGGKISTDVIKNDKIVATAKQNIPNISKPQVKGATEVSKSTVKGVVGGDMGSRDLSESRLRTQEVANMQVNLMLAILLLPKKVIEYILGTETDTRVLAEVEKYQKLEVAKLKKGQTLDLQSKLNDGLFGFRTKKMVLEFKKAANITPLVPTEMKLKNESSPIVDQECKNCINYILDKYLFSWKNITVYEPKTQKVEFDNMNTKVKVTPETTISDISKSLGKAVTGGTEE